MKLSTEERKKLKSSDYALPKERAYPMHTVEHAKDSLTRSAQGSSPDEHAKVKAAIQKRYPQLAKGKRDLSPNEVPSKKFQAPDASALGSG